ncbi:hypothetical protein [Methylophilus sp. 5]|uniref:hypothetical protein n=1 Tax=Methylophilus sp. 5 TaxID=1112274 RepID=UPI00048B4976|nr:hypothetical protein [Methylophilus sp. 5]
MRILRKIIDFFSKATTLDNHQTIRISSGDPLSAFKDGQDVMESLEFIATLQFRTPLRVLMLDGAKHADPLKPLPDMQIDEWHGTWVPKLKSWRELGLDIDELEDSVSASQIGYVDRKSYLPFLIAVRTQVESKGSIDERIYQLRAELQKQKWSDYVQKHQGIDAVINTFFPLFIDTLPGLSVPVKEQLTLIGIKTPNQLSSAGFDVLTAIKGIGKVKAASMKKYADEVVSNRDNERLDSVD